MSASERPIDRDDEQESEPAALGAVEASVEVPSVRSEAPAPPRPPRRRLRLALAVASMAIVVALGIGIYEWLRDPVFPLDDVNALPKDFVAVKRVRSKSFANAFPGFPELRLDQAMWSRLAHDVCGGADLYKAFMLQRRTPAPRVAAELIVDPSSKQALQCGREISRKMGKRAFEVTLVPPSSSAHPLPIQIFDLNLAHGLAPDVRDPTPPPRGLDELVCGADDGAPIICLPTMQVAGRLAGSDLYAVGSLEDVKHLGEGFSASGDNLPSRADDLEALADDVSAYKTAEVGKHEWFSSDVLVSLGAMVTRAGIFDSAPAANHLREALVACDVVWAYGDGIGSDGGEASLWLRAARETDVPALVAAVEEWRREAALALPKELFDEYAGLSPVERKYVDAINAMAIESLKSASIERKGRDVIVRFVRVVPDASVALVADMRKEVATRARSSAHVIDATLQGAPPNAQDLETIGGQELVKAVEEARTNPEKKFGLSPAVE